MISTFPPAFSLCFGPPSTPSMCFSHLKVELFKNTKKAKTTSFAADSELAKLNCWEKIMSVCSDIDGA